MRKRAAVRKAAETSISYVPVAIYHDPQLIEQQHAGGINYIDERGRGMVRIDSTMPASAKYECLLHEFIHLADSVYCLKLSERKVTILGHCLAQAMLGLKKTIKRRRKR